MLSQSMKENDHKSILELKRSLLELERRSEMKDGEGSPEDPKQSEASFRAHSFSATRASESPKKNSKSDVSIFSATEREYLEKAIMQNTKQYDEQLTIMLIGNRGVGKTCLMNSWLGSSSIVPKHTIGYLLTLLLASTRRP
eukprot:TRINITY_DN1964_c0_g1_i2.p2 TRINITY_DN1964_c0_g1~~TRINITY_DN1964_c0_g1_i2.p2  ORF type:complete len:141 (+),score=23.29 TRINITY_DN1964_c0_g1_i2:438-860(+)